ncbi:unnamed protein product [Rotaria socialis]|uniref:Uncharacterized protein n=1 Tax=Rotaria socialis TaxID=392032 RepID=A0A820WGN8_9BILA|nr:unnamed protein product [Rotaria socialis]CAF4515782.1 unnamed protein product [Rotaria socialis]
MDMPSGPKTAPTPQTAATATASPSGSSNKGQQIISSPSSTPKCYHRHWNELRHLESIWTDTNLDGVQSQQYRTAIQAAHLANRMQHMHIIPDPNACTRPRLPNISSSNTVSLQHEISSEDRLIERFKDVMNEFVSRPYRQYSYDTNMRWSIDHCEQIRFSVIVSIKKP